MIRSLIVAAVLTTTAVPAAATTLVLGSGWQDDTTNVIGEPSEGSAWTFTLTADAVFRVTDAFAVGDIYTVSDGANGILAQTTYSTDGAAVDDYFGTAWSDTSFSRLGLLLGAGSYAITITGDCGGGCPAGLGVRLDAVSTGAVPEPASWAMLIAGFGLVGASMRRRRMAVA